MNTINPTNCNDQVKQFCKKNTFLDAVVIGENAIKLTKPKRMLDRSIIDIEKRAKYGKITKKQSAKFQIKATAALYG